MKKYNVNMTIEVQGGTENTTDWERMLKEKIEEWERIKVEGIKVWRIAGE